ncbi:rhodanese-like domain-containing protein [Deinococcus sp. ZS9-10]|uniref:Rhodanese-like domain-containing protein n=1 Tax=Deinococcus arenicola TaxID=2994950 RepID=A0ABU4DUQ6_9DEIO|nr:rhodanese-like domain-containing protein [Deinococcus sp. ZS9-10]MDV6375424.1 rhodanese-like domain-containing protein [Deinococcus sp. ZS9-10]
MPEKTAGRLAHLPAGKTIICQCGSGGRSVQATQIMKGAGPDARNLHGGLRAWQSAGLPVKTKK